MTFFFSHLEHSVENVAVDVECRVPLAPIFQMLVLSLEVTTNDSQKSHIATDVVGNDGTRIHVGQFVVPLFQGLAVTSVCHVFGFGLERNSLGSSNCHDARIV